MRAVMTSKIDEDTQEEVVKCRLTVRGDKDPDVLNLVRKSVTNAPTISSNGKVTMLQTIASMGFTLQLGDVKGAFLEADKLERASGPLYLRQPARGLPGLLPGQLLEVLKPLYGFNDSPQNWFRKFLKTLVQKGWQQSNLDASTAACSSSETSSNASWACADGTWTT